jgi:DNA-binding response OmpR family regulator
LKIIIIEDDPEIAALERDYLVAHSHEVTISNSGTQGLEWLRQNDWDLVLLDLMLPGMSGFEVLRELRAFSDKPCLLVSARSDDIDKIRGLGLLADDYITKPFSPGELVARVEAHGARYNRLTGSSVQRVLRIRDLELDISDHRVKKLVNGTWEEIGLTSKEFDLLSFLMTYPNRAWSKEELFVKVWGMDAMGDNATVVVHIQKIREKLEEDPSNPQYIQTIWGIGYRLET